MNSIRMALAIVICSVLALPASAGALQEERSPLPMRWSKLQLRQREKALDLQGHRRDGASRVEEKTGNVSSPLLLIGIGF
jgi:hypothetical protein